MKVFVSTYAKYLYGSLAGKWVDLSEFSDNEEFVEKCKEIHEDEKDPEFMFQDWEGIPESLISESNIDEVVFEVLNEPDINFDAFCAFVNFRGYCDDISIFRDAFVGDYSKENYPRLAFTEDYIEETGILSEIPDNLQFYFDIQLYSRDLFLSDFYEQDGYIFCNI